MAASVENAAIIAGYGHHEDCDGTCAVVADAGDDDAALLERIADLEAKALAMKQIQDLKRQRRIVNMELPARSGNGR